MTDQVHLVRAFPSAAAVAGILPGVSAVRQAGINADVDSGSVPETLWKGGGLYPWQAASYSLEVISGDAADDGDPAGTGAQTVTVEGLDANGAAQSATVTLNGVSAVAIPTVTWSRVHRAYVVAVGSGGTNAGLITVRLASAGATQATIVAGDGESSMATYTVPANATGFLLGWRANIALGATGAEATVQVWSRESGESWRLRDTMSPTWDGNTENRRKLDIPIRLGAQADIELRCTGTGGIDDLILAGSLDLVIADSSIL